MARISKEQQTINAQILRDEIRKGGNTKKRVYNLIKDIIDSGVFFDDLNQVNISIVTGSSFTAETTSHFIHYSGNTSGNIYLPSSPKINQQIIISDAVGNAFSNNITIQGNGKLINGVSTALLDSNYGTLMFVYNGTNWLGSGFTS